MVYLLALASLAYVLKEDVLIGLTFYSGTVTLCILAVVLCGQKGKKQGYTAFLCLDADMSVNWPHGSLSYKPMTPLAYYMTCHVH